MGEVMHEGNAQDGWAAEQKTLQAASHEQCERVCQGVQALVVAGHPLGHARTSAHGTQHEHGEPTPLLST